MNTKITLILSLLISIMMLSTSVTNAQCDAGTMTTTGAVQVMGDMETFEVGAENFTIPADGIHWWLFLPSGDAAGGPFNGSPWARPTETGIDTFFSTIDGTNPAMTGTWTIFSYVTATQDINDECDRSTNSLTVLFDATPIVEECEAGIMTSVGTVFVDDNTPTFTVSSVDRITPFDGTTNGGYTWSFIPGPDGTGALGGPFSFGTIASESSTYDEDLNGVLSGANFPPFAGTWYVKGQMSTDGMDVNTASATICDTTTDSLTVIFSGPDPETGCNAGILTTTDPVEVAVGETFTINVDNDTVPNMPTQGSYGYFLTPINGATGGLGNEFIIFASAGTNVYDNSLDGILSGDPPLAGEWVFRGTVFGDVSDPFNTVCSQTADSLIVNFEEQIFPCSAGSFFSTETQIVCTDQQVTVGIMNNTDSIPQGGGRGWEFDDSAGGIGGIPGGVTVTDATSPAAYDNDLGGLLSANGLAPLEGAFILRSVTYSNNNDPLGTVCATSTDSILVIFAEEVDLQILDNGNEYTAFPGNNFMDFTYAWSTGETTQTIIIDDFGDYSVTATDNLGCETVADLVLVSTNEADIVSNLSVAPNPTTGLINIALELPATEEVQLSVIDITGKEVINLAPVTFTSRNFEVDLQGQAAGLYLLRFRIGNDVVTRRVAKN